MSQQLRTHPSPNPTLTLTCYQLNFVGQREGWMRSFLYTDNKQTNEIRFGKFRQEISSIFPSNET